MTARFGVLGSIEVWARDGTRLDIGHPRQRWVLGALLADAGTVVTADTLVDRVWGGSAPRSARETLYGYVSRLRRALSGAGVELARDSLGYRLAVAPAAVDARLFGDLVRTARAEGGSDTALDLWEQALGLWRGEAYAGADTPWFNARRELLAGERLAAELDLTDVRLERGRHGRMLTELAARAADHPLDERITAQLMLALYRAGRASDALAHYRRTSRLLAEELGTDPGPALALLHQRVLAADPLLDPAGPARALPPPVAADLAAPAAGTAPAARTAGPPVPRQLPPCPAGFVGRGMELAGLAQVLDAAAGSGGTAVISSIAGTGGIGKTWLALRWAHACLDRFPDGQLHADLRGFDPSGVPVPPDVVTRGFLDALGVDPGAMPSDPGARTGLYRSLTAGRRLLVVLDNARDSAQADPLLPGGGSCAVLVTSRSRLSGLVTARGAVPVVLDLLDPAEARKLLSGRLGARRTGAEPDAVGAIVEHCGRLPLALAIVAARAAAHPGFPLSAVADELRDAHGSLDAFESGDHASDARAVFSWSYRTLSSGAARLFRLLGLHPGPDCAQPAAAGLLGAPVREARSALAELAAAHLVTEHAPGRYALHDLLRAYAAELVAGDDARTRRAALGRLLDHYAASAHAADRVLAPHRDPLDSAPASPGAGAVTPPDHGRAMEWFGAERPVLVAAVELAAREGFDAQVRELTWALTTYLGRRSLWPDLVATQLLGLRTADRLGDHRWRARCHVELANARGEGGRPDEAHQHLAQAVDLFQELGDRVGEGHARLSLGWLYERQGDKSAALDQDVRALALFRAAGHPAGEARALNAVGWDHAQLGDHARAAAHCRQALTVQRKLGDVRGEANTWDSLGFAYQHLGEHGRAADCYRRAVELNRTVGHRFNEAEALAHLGDVGDATGDHAAALESWREAAAILADIGHTGALTDRLTGLVGTPQSP
ncbi:AfsR/SARP family transcriptional regulator [Streptomyces uncialis]|uniref:AfsR/SARP family transcriptional regulator n=1 Tax=Streptomyces uncialis TaxID=1048205 RepID=UPI00382B7CA7